MLCDKGCHHVENLAHICQVCPAAWGPRIRRHNNILYLVRQRLRRSGYLVELEPQFRTDTELLRPDLLAVRDGSAWVIDVQVVSDSRHFTLCAAHQMKMRKYQDVVPIVQARDGIKEVALSTVTVNWRGCGAEETAVLWKDLGLYLSDVKIVSLRALSGSAVCVRTFFATAGGARLMMPDARSGWHSGSVRPPRDRVPNIT